MKRKVSIRNKNKHRRSKKLIQSGGVTITLPFGTYDGEVNSENLPHGHGEITYNDLSVYVGDWING
jgi:hypothetical protein